jgi:hypothetical protein
MRRQLFAAATATFIAGSAWGEPPVQLPDGTPADAIVSGASSPALLPAPGSAPTAVTESAVDGIVADGGSTGLRPGVDCLPNPFDLCQRAPRFYGDVAFLLAWFKDGPNPTPLVTSGTAQNFGTLGSPGIISVLYGARDIDFGTFNGARATVGYWLDNKATTGIEASGFVLERRADLFNVFSDGGPNSTIVIARPLVDTTLPPPGEDVFVVAQPGVQSGGVTATASSRLWGAEGNLVRNFRDHCQSRIDLLGGFRYIDLLETLTINESSALIGSPMAANEVDSFECRNQFYGGQFGARWTITRGPLSLTTVSKLALGTTHESITRLGSTTFFGFGPAPITVLGGQLVLPSNYGQDTRDRFAVAPATSLQVAYQMTRHASVFMGYDFLYISSVVRPGENIDRVLDPAGLPLPTGPGTVAARPAGGIKGSDFYVNAITMGLSFTY